MDRSKIGNLMQIGGVRNYLLTDGWAKDMRAMDVKTGAGLQYTILPDRGMDISFASYKQINLSFITNNGETHPAYFQEHGIGWLHTFAAGLLTTCGYDNIGAPCKADGQEFGLHGRYSTIPARQVADLSHWEGDDYFIIIKGIVEEGRLFGSKLQNKREIRSVLGQNSINITDTVTNTGNCDAPLLLLYHFNLGYPLLDSNVTLQIDAIKSWPRDASSEKGLSSYSAFPEPIPGVTEEVFIHQLESDQNGITEVRLINPSLKIQFYLRYSPNELPYLAQWKMPGVGEYVLGLEPCNSPCKNREMLSNENALPMLKPGESKKFYLEIGIKEII